MNEVALMRFARAALGRPFVWGHMDCALLALRALEVLRPLGAAAAYEGLWCDAREALRHFDVESPSDVLARFGLVSIAPSLAAAGDVMLAPAPPFPEAAHVVLGRFSLSASPEYGVHLVDTAALAGNATSAWRLG